MAHFHRYKKIENNLVKSIKDGLLWIVRGIGFLFALLGRLLVRNYSVVIMPVSGKKVYNLHIRFAAVVLLFALVFGATAVFFFYGYNAAMGGSQGGFIERDGKTKEIQADLDRLREEVNQLSQAAQVFKGALSGTLSTLGVNSTETPDFTGDRPSLFSVPGNSNTLREVEDLRQLSGYLSSALEPVREIGTILDSQSAILSEIPSIWPIRGGGSHITQRFGINPDPFTGVAQMHTGVDISTYRQGDPIIATADGQVSLIAYEPNGFGNYVILRHQHGFYTRYAHMLSFRVQADQMVKQGDVIGYVGNTGRSTGPHLHYEVHIGSDVVDPSKYLKIRPNLLR